MKKEDLIKKIARLEFANDQLVTELSYIDGLMRQIGFTEGLESLKTTARELYDTSVEPDDHSEDAA